MKTAPTLRIDRLLVRGGPYPGRAFADRPFSDRGGGTGGDRPEDLLKVARLGADFQDRPGVRLQELVDVDEYRLPLVRDRDQAHGPGELVALSGFDRLEVGETGAHGVGVGGGHDHRHRVVVAGKVRDSKA